jgi:signal transduction histidine kinase
VETGSSSIHVSSPPSATGVDRVQRLPWVISGILAALIAYAYYPYHEILGKLDLKTSRTVASAVLLIGMTGLYFHASKFYRDKFYLLLSLAWLGNLVYLAFDLGSPPPTSPDYARFRSFSMLLAVASDLPLYVAGTTPRDEEPKFKSVLVPSSIIFFWFIIYFAVRDAHAASTIQTVVATAFATYVLIRVYRAFTSRIDISSPWNQLLRYTFLAYAVIQPTFLFVFSNDLRFLVKHIMSLALVIKLINAVALAVMLRDDFGRFRADAERAEDQLKQRSEFAEIGLLTASIEHELRTPLGAMSTKLDRMKEDYQSDPIMLSHLDFLDNQRVRILAATRIINTLRSSREYFRERMETVKVADLVRKSVKDVRYEEGLATDRIAFNVEEHMERLFVKAYPPLLEQAFVNILKNSVESIQIAGRTRGDIHVDISAPHGTTDYVFIRFQDNGTGFRPEDEERLTKPGFTTKGEKKVNSGLGLFVCDRIIRLHDGKLLFKNLDNRGAAVTTVLPRIEPKKRQVADGKSRRG